ncbi:DciA family protein [Luteibacter sp. E-22]|uniref:DciA family protein n=1 Tax=Luteibacter sp. E-22 TaxID=3404050 RepID=UPI003CEEA635
MPPPSQPPRRSTRGLTSITEFGPVASLAQRARELDQLDRQLRATLPSPLRDQVRFADLRDGRLVFLAPSSAWASRVRLYQTQILEAARAIGAKAHSVAVKVAPLPPVEVIPDRHKPLSTSAARHLRSAAASLSDPTLRDLFLGLASKAENSE